MIGQLAGLDELRPSFLFLPPEELRRLRAVAWLVEDEEAGRVDVVEAGRRTENARPDLGCVARLERSGQPEATAWM